MIKKTPAEYVNPYIGTIGHLLTATRPVAALPHSPVQIFPTVAPGMQDYFLSDRIVSFPLCTISVMFADKNAADMAAAVSHFDISAVKSHPYSYSVYLEDSDIDVSGSTTMHGCVYRVTNAAKIFIRSEGAVCTAENGKLLLEKKEGKNSPRRSWTVIAVPGTVECVDGCITVTDPGDEFEIAAAVSYVSAEKAKEIFALELEEKLMKPSPQNRKRYGKTCSAESRSAAEAKNSRPPTTPHCTARSARCTITANTAATIPAMTTRFTKAASIP